MRKTLFTKLMLIMAVVLMGAGTAWAEDKTITLDYSSFGLTTSYAEKTATVDGFGFTVNQGYKGSGNVIQMNSSKGSGILYNTTAITGLKSIAVNVYSGEKTYTITTGTSEKPTANSQTGTTTGTYNATSGDTYFQLKVSGASYFSSIVITYDDDSSSDTRTTTTVTIDDSGITNTNVFTGTNAGSLAATVKAGEETIEGAIVTWSTEDTNVATVDATSGAVTLVAAGTATITASYAGDETDYKPSSATYKLTVVNEDPSAITLWSEDFGTGYEANTTTYSYVLTNGGSTTKIYDSDALAGGTAPELLVSKTSGSFKATIPLDNIEGDLTLTFKTNNGNVAVTTNSSAVTVSGDVTSGTSTLTLSGVTAAMTSIDIIFTNSTSSNCRLDDIVLKGSQSTKADPELSFATTTYTVGLNAAFATPTLTNPHNLTVTYSSSDENLAVVDENTGEVVIGNTEGEVTITASFAGNDDYRSGSASYTITIQDQRTAIATINGLTPAQIAINATGNFTVDATYASADATDYEVTLTSSDTDALLIEGFEYAAGTTKGDVTVTVKVEPADDTTYKAVEETFTVNIYDPNANDGSAEHPYTVAEAIDATPTTGEVYISGIVSSFYNTSIVGDGSNYRYYISDDGTTTTQLLVYKGKGLNNEAFSDADDLKVGDEVVIYGKLITYQNAPEVAASNYLISWNRPASTEPTLTVDADDKTINVDVAGTITNHEQQTIKVNFANFTTAPTTQTVFVEYCDENGDALETGGYEWITSITCNWVSDGYFTMACTFAENTESTSRTAYVKVYAVNDNVNVYSDLITITQAAPVTGNQYALFTGDLVEGDYIIYYNGNAMNTTVTSDRLQYAEVTPTDYVITTDDAAIVWHIAKSGDYWTIYNADADAYAAGTGAKNKAQMLEDGTDDKALWTVSGDETYEFVNKANATNEVNSNLRNNGTYGFACYATSTGGALSLYKKVEESVTITAAGYATYCSENALDFSAVEGLTAYTATIANNQVNFTKVEKVPAREGVLLKGAEGTYTVPVIASATAIDNDFEGVLVDTEKEAGIYVLMNPDGGQGVGFYRTTQSFTVRANSAYLPALAGTARSFIGLDDVTSVKDITAETMQNGEVYNLQGQRVESSIFNVQSSMLKKGLYIVNGKKVIK